MLVERKTKVANNYLIHRGRPADNNEKCYSWLTDRQYQTMVDLQVN